MKSSSSSSSSKIGMFTPKSVLRRCIGEAWIFGVNTPILLLLLLLLDDIFDSQHVQMTLLVHANIIIVVIVAFQQKLVSLSK